MESDVKSKYIDHMIFSIYIDSETNKGSIMFGNYDVNGAVDQGKNLNILRTTNSKTWLMALTSATFEDDTIRYDVPMSSSKQIIIDPLEQFILMGSNDIVTVESSLARLVPAIDCSKKAYQQCVIMQPCSEVVWSTTNPKLTLGMGTPNVEFEMDLKDFFVDSADLSPKIKNHYCHAAIGENL